MVRLEWPIVQSCTGQYVFRKAKRPQGARLGSGVIGIAGTPRCDVFARVPAGETDKLIVTISPHVAPLNGTDGAARRPTLSGFVVVDTKTPAIIFGASRCSFKPGAYRVRKVLGIAADIRQGHPATTA